MLKALVLTLGGTPRESSSASNIRCSFCSTGAKLMKFTISFTSKHSSWAQHLLKVTPKLQKRTKQAKLVKKPKVIVLNLSENLRESFSTSNIRCSFCSTRSKSNKFGISVTSKHSSWAQHLFRFTQKLTNKMQNQSVAWYACEASLGKERYVKLNEWKIRRTVC